MTQEEKARRYDEAIAKGKQIQNTPYTAHWDTMKEVVEHLFPELKESEDERIRKALISILKSDFEKDTTIYDISVSDIIAWLKRQGKQKPIKWSNKDEEMIECCIKALKFFEDLGKHTSGLPHPNYFEIDSRIYPEDVRNWLKSLKERVQPKQEWSEEDKEALRVITNIFEQHGTKLLHYPAFVHWLKRLPNRITFNPYWKPSDEQIQALEHFVRSVGESGYASPYDNNTKLYSLLEQLKKLKQ